MYLSKLLGSRDDCETPARIRTGVTIQFSELRDGNSSEMPTKTSMWSKPALLREMPEVEMVRQHHSVHLAILNDDFRTFDVDMLADEA